MTWKVYVIHFDKPYKHAKHYTGIAINVEKRMKEHRGGYGSRLMQVLKENNIGFRYNIIAEYPSFSDAHAEEKRLKTKVKQPKKYCPICKENKLIKSFQEIPQCDCGSLTYTGCVCKIKE